jgi:biopolymer transport protein ExbB/TolQ
MLGTDPGHVKPEQVELLDPAGNPTADWRQFFTSEVVCVTTTLLILLSAVVAALLALGFRRQSGRGRRQRAVSKLLDSADALEARLRTARAEIQAVAGDDDNPIQEALREMLRQRLWLQQHGQTASLQELETVRVSIDQARARIEDQLVRIERARAPIA